MEFTANAYLELYSKLNDPAYSKQANMRLLELQNRDEAFKIAAELMGSEDYFIHGCQLLSKKLNNPVPPSIPLEQLLVYLLNYPKKTDLLYCCIAKLFIHLQIIQLPQSLLHTFSQNNQQYSYFILRVFKELPSAIYVTRTPQGTRTEKNKQLQEQLFQKCKPLLIERFEIQSELVLGCIEAQVLSHRKLNSDKLLTLLLKQDLESSREILQEIFLNQKYPNLNETIWKYLQIQEKNTQLDMYFSVYLAFCRSLVNQLLTMQSDKLLQLILGKVLTIMRSDSENVDDNSHRFIADTFEFWFQLVTAYRQTQKSKLPGQNQTILWHAMAEVWNTVLKASLKKEIVQRSTKKEPIVIDLDCDDLQQLNSEDIYAALPDSSNRFRLSAEDFITTCMDFAHQLHQVDENAARQLFQIMYKALYSYASSQKLTDIELAIYVLQSIVQIPPEKQIQSENLYQTQIVKALMMKQDLLNIQLCEKLILLLGKLEKIMSGNMDVFRVVLDFMKKALAVQDLSFVAAQNFCQILVEYNVEGNQKQDEKQQHMKHIESFLSDMYEQVYGKTKDLLVVQELTKSLIAFIFKFRNTGQSYISFLNTFAGKINEHTSIKHRSKYIECLLSSSVWAYGLGLANKVYLMILGQFMTNDRILQTLLGSCTAASSKTDLSSAVKIINLAIKLLGHFNTQMWVKLIEELVKKLLEGAHRFYGNILSPLVTLMDLSSIYQDVNSVKLIVQLLEKYELYITQYLIKAQEHNYNLTKAVLQIHESIIKNYSANKFNVTYQAYDPSKITHYISQKILKNPKFTEYQILREAFNVCTLLIRLNYSLNLILESCLLSHRRTSDGLWRNLQTVILEAYHKGKQPLFLEVFSRVKPELLPPNPMWPVFIQSLQKNDNRAFKNILLCLS